MTSAAVSAARRATWVDRSQVADADLPAHRHAAEPERQLVRQLRERRVRPRAAAAGIGNHADAVAARDLSTREIDDVPEQSADRRAQHMQDIEGTARFV